jgi:hypothetical protein
MSWQGWIRETFTGKKPISWVDWGRVILLGVAWLGTIVAGHPFKWPNSATAIRSDLFSLTVWGLFFLSLLPFIRKIVARKY